MGAERRLSLRARTSIGAFSGAQGGFDQMTSSQMRGYPAEKLLIGGNR